MLSQCLASLTSGDEALAEKAARELATLPSERVGEAFHALARLLDSPEEDRRWWAIRALSELPDERVSRVLAQALADPGPSVRQCALLGLRQCPEPETIPALTQLLQDPDPLTARLAGEALAALGAKAVEPLLEIMENGSLSTRLLATRTLAELRDSRAIPALFAALDDESMLVEYWANEGLERLGVGMTFFAP